MIRVYRPFFWEDFTFHLISRLSHDFTVICYDVDPRGRPVQEPLDFAIPVDTRNSLDRIALNLATKSKGLSPTSTLQHFFLPLFSISKISPKQPWGEQSSSSSF